MTEGDAAFEPLRGGHGLLRELPGVRVWGVDDGIPAKQIQKRLGMESEEVQRLVNRAGMPSQVRRVAPAFNRAWVPGKG